MNCLRRWTTLANLARATNVRGQIATLLIFMTVVMLILVMVTVNVGNIAIDSTMMANAADAAVYQMASMLHTKSNQVWQSMGYQLEICQKRGWASSVLGFIGAIVAVFFCQPCLAAMVSAIGPALGALGAGAYSIVGATTLATGIVGGAAGGALGGGIAGTGAGAGALTGATLGASVGTFSLGASAVSGVNAGVLPTSATTISPMTSAVGTAALGVAGVSASAYNTSVQYHLPRIEAKILSKMLTTLSEYDQIRESAFLLAFTAMVDDPTTETDYEDTDGDGDYQEKVPSLQVWLYDRFKLFNQLGYGTSSSIDFFIDGAATWFRDTMVPAYTGYDYQTYVGPPLGYTTTHVPGILETADYKWQINPLDGGEDAVPNPGNDGDIIKLFRALWGYGYRLPTSTSIGALGSVPGSAYAWEPDTNITALQNWMDQNIDCPTCSPTSPPATYDEFDAMLSDIMTMVTVIDGIKAMDRQQANDTVRSWFDIFYDRGDPYSPDSIYGRLNIYFNMLTDWSNEVYNIKASLPNCNTGWMDITYDPITWAIVSQRCRDCADNLPAYYQIWGGCPLNCAMNPPCKVVEPWGATTATIDMDMTDDFWPAIGAIDTLRYEMYNFKSYIETMASVLYGSALDSAFAGLGGLNPARYSWTDDRGYNAVEVEAGDFVLARTEERKSGNWFKGKVCISMVDYSDQDRCWIRITRESDRLSVGPLGRFNPFGRRKTKVSKASYSYDFMRLANPNNIFADGGTTNIYR